MEEQNQEGVVEQLLGAAAPSLLSADDVAELLSVSPWTVRRMARDKAIGSLKIGKQYKFTHQQVREYLRGRVTVPAQAA